MFTNLKPIYTDALNYELNDLYRKCKKNGYKEYPDSKKYTQPEGYGVYKRIIKRIWCRYIATVSLTLSLWKMVPLL